MVDFVLLELPEESGGFFLREGKKMGRNTDEGISGDNIRVIKVLSPLKIKQSEGFIVVRNEKLKIYAIKLAALEKQFQEVKEARENVENARHGGMSMVDLSVLERTAQDEHVKYMTEAKALTRELNQLVTTVNGSIELYEHRAKNKESKLAELREEIDVLQKQLAFVRGEAAEKKSKLADVQSDLVEIAHEIQDIHGTPQDVTSDLKDALKQIVRIDEIRGGNHAYPAHHGSVPRTYSHEWVSNHDVVTGQFGTQSGISPGGWGSMITDMSSFAPTQLPDQDALFIIGAMNREDDDDGRPQVVVDHPFHIGPDAPARGSSFSFDEAYHVISRPLARDPASDVLEALDALRGGQAPIEEHDFQGGKVWTDDDVEVYVWKNGGTFGL